MSVSRLSAADDHDCGLVKKKVMLQRGLQMLDRNAVPTSATSPLAAKWALVHIGFVGRRTNTMHNNAHPGTRPDAGPGQGCLRGSITVPGASDFRQENSVANMHLPHWTPFKLFKSRSSKPTTGTLQQDLHKSADSQILSPPHKPSRFATSTTITEAQATVEVEEAEDMVEPAEEKPPIARAYHIARIARSRLQKEAERQDHDLRLLVGHANLLDHLAETIGEVNPDFDIDDLEPYIESPVSSSDNSILPKPIRRGRIDDILRKINLSEDGDDDAFDEDDEDDEVYDESEDELDDPPTPPSSPEQAEFGCKQDYGAVFAGYDLISNVEFSMQSDYGHDNDSCIVTEQSCVEYSLPNKTNRRISLMPIITITAIGEDT
ncbi:hypothetical protein BST61_g8619 [Cercospora zeina]